MKSRRIIISLIATIMLLSLIGCGSYSKEIALFINTRAGDSYKYQVTVNQIFDEELFEQKTRSKQNITIDYVLNVESIGMRRDHSGSAVMP